MSSSFLTGLANQISDQFGIGENQSHTLDIVQNGHNEPLGKLGEFSKQIDQSAERRYLETGYLRLDSFNVIPQQSEILWQEPDVTVLIKKRAFASLSENYRSDVSNNEEKLYIKVTKILFQNKCRQISAFEKLSKIERIGAASGQLDDQLMPLIISLVDEASNNFQDLSSGATSPGDFSSPNSSANSSAAQDFKKLSNVIDKVRKVYAFSPSNYYTTWVADNTNIFKTEFSQGTGVIELTNITSLNTTTATKFGGGSFTIHIADPYNLMRITEYDIEKAISDALNFVANKKLFQLGKESLDKIATNNLKRLNDSRTSRGASKIEIITSPDTFLGKRVRAIIEGSGTEVLFDYNSVPNLSLQTSSSGVTISSEFLRGGIGAGQDGLDTGAIGSASIGAAIFGKSVAQGFANSEVSLFQDTISATFTSLDFQRSQQSTIAQQGDFKDSAGKSTLDINGVRRKLRLHYCNKTIVQNMDQVHIFIGSKSQVDNKVLSGLQNMFTGLGYFQNLNNNVFNIKNQFNTLFSPSQNVNMQLEKSVFVGPNFPNGLWSMMRNLFVNDKSGSHVFAGVVDSSSGNMTPGKYSVTFSGKDNTAFFGFGTVNLNPGVDTFNGPLYDPLTPFKTTTDTVTSNFANQIPELLQENKEILAHNTFKEGLVRYKSGRHAGKPVTMDNFFQDVSITKDGSIRRVYHAPDGMVYKWKEGIGVFTAFGDSFNANDPARIGTPAITVDPFAGQDVMNVLSLLITGVPYNYATFYKAAAEFDQSATNPQSGQNSSASFFNSLSTTLKKNNLLWGSFIPFKNLVISDQDFSAMNTQQVSILIQNSVIASQLAEILDLKNKIASSIPISGIQDGPSKTQIESLQNTLKGRQAGLDLQLTKQKQNIQKLVGVSVIGNDVSFDPSQKTDTNSLSNPKIRKELRRRTNFLTRRLSWSIRANEDKNLLIVDDSYDKDYDILAFEKALKGKINQFDNAYSTVGEKITSVAQLLNLEVFCDTQGHIRIRPQQYNRMPSSIFYRMMQLKQRTGVQIYPNFLETLFVDQLNSLLRRMEILELEIRLDGAIIGIADDSKLAQYLNSSNKTFNTWTGFSFFSDANGNIVDVETMANSADPDTVIQKIPSSFDSKLKQQNAITSSFNIIDRAALIKALPDDISSTINKNQVNKLITLIFNKSGQHPTLNNFDAQPDGTVVMNSSSQVDSLKITQDLADKVSERQKLVKTLSSAYKNAKEAIKLDTDPANTANKMLFPDLFGNNEVPEMFEHMIEDEGYDDFGPGSGSRYVIKDHQILRLNIAEVSPEFTMIEVSGQLDPFISKDSLPSGFNGAFPKGGNSIVTAAAVDYDLWRQYGFRSQHSVNVPFLSNPETQCAPYAVSLLSRARREIIQGDIEISGNEFMQPGEVVFIESSGLLFYVESVSHAFSFSSQSFHTTLTLKYGHNPGEYIPTSLDVIGKLLYNNRDTSSSIMYRQTNIYNETSLGAIIVSRYVSGPDMITGGNYGEFNLKIINDMLYSSAGTINANKAISSNIKTTVELRIFYNSKNQAVVDSVLDSARTTLKRILIGTADTNVKSLSNKPPLKFDETDVILVNIDISDPNESRSPSQKAIDMARNVLKTFPGAAGVGNGNGGDKQIQNPLLNATANYVIDCVLKLTGIQ